VTARAGHCTECGEDTWLRTGGGCIQGHDPRCVQSARVVPLPASLDHFNWGAFFFPVIWPLVEGPYIWAGVFFGLGLLGNLIGAATRAAWVPYVGAVWALGTLGLHIWYARNANRLIWEWHPERVDVAGFPLKERRWARIGVILLFCFGALLACAIMSSLGSAPPR
jgi:hypothetical protein